jgi:3-phytase
MAFPGSVTADVETATASGSGDVVDDPAILIHPTTPSSSVIVTTNKDYSNGGIYVYDLGGTLVESESVGNAYNNVDTEYNFGGTAQSPTYSNIIGATGRESGDLHFWTYDWSDSADEMTAIGTIDTGWDPNVNEPYGFTMGRLGDTTYAFASADDGTQVKQWELSESGGVVSGTLVRTLNFSGQVEGMVVDDENGFTYIAEEDGSIKKFETDPGTGGAHDVVDSVSGNLTADIEGLAIYYGGDPTEGYLIASSQGSDQYAVYERDGSNNYLGKFTMGSDSSVDGATDTDGLDVSSYNFGGSFDEGLFVVHDNDNTGETSSNFKLVEWDEIATLGGLITDTTHDPRAPVTGGPTNPSTPPPPAFFTINTTDASTVTYTGTSGADTLSSTNTATSIAEKYDGLQGADTYNGGLGDDFYVIENTGDTIGTEGGGQDLTEVWGTFNYTMPSNIEHLVAQGSTSRTFTGNSDDNIMSASGTGTGTMTMLGLTGADNIRVGARDVTATGGADGDIFRYNASAVGDGNTITDFTWGEDLLDLSAAVSSSTAPTVNPFTNGVLSLTNSGSNVKVLYDQDGSAGGTYSATEIVELVGVQVDAGINTAHVYTGL